MIRKIIFLFIALPIAVLLIVLSVANRQPVTLSLDPFNQVNPALAFSWPFFVFLFCAVLAGMILGSLATWFSQGRHRKLERKNKAEALKWRDEATTQKKRAEELATELNPELKGLPTTGKAA